MHLLELDNVRGWIDDEGRRIGCRVAAGDGWLLVEMYCRGEVIASTLVVVASEP